MRTRSSNRIEAPPDENEKKRKATNDPSVDRSEGVDEEKKWDEYEADEEYNPYSHHPNPPSSIFEVETIEVKGGGLKEAMGTYVRYGTNGDDDDFPRFILRDENFRPSEWEMHYDEESCSWRIFKSSNGTIAYELYNNSFLPGRVDKNGNKKVFKLWGVRDPLYIEWSVSLPEAYPAPKLVASELVASVSEARAKRSDEDKKEVGKEAFNEETDEEDEYDPWFMGTSSIYDFETIVVSGAGIEEANGTYLRYGTHDGYPRFIIRDQNLRPSEWEMHYDKGRCSWYIFKSNNGANAYELVNMCFFRRRVNKHGKKEVVKLWGPCDPIYSNWSVSDLLPASSWPEASPAPKVSASKLRPQLVA